MSFEGVYRDHFPSLFRYVQRSLGDPELAEDVTQEAFLRFLVATVPERDARPWLFRVASNLIRDHRRKSRRRAGLLNQWKWLRPARSDSADAEGSLTASRIRDALDALSDRDRTLLLMRAEGFRYRQIAEVVGVADASVGTLIARALERFREAYEPD